jgi:hypothetical protein
MFLFFRAKKWSTRRQRSSDQNQCQTCQSSQSVSRGKTETLGWLFITISVCLSLCFLAISHSVINCVQSSSDFFMHPLKVSKKWIWLSVLEKTTVKLLCRDMFLGRKYNFCEKIRIFVWLQIKHLICNFLYLSIRNQLVNTFYMISVWRVIKKVLSRYPNLKSISFQWKFVLFCFP